MKGRHFLIAGGGISEWTCVVFRVSTVCVTRLKLRFLVFHRHCGWAGCSLDYIQQIARSDWTQA